MSAKIHHYPARRGGVEVDHIAGGRIAAVDGGSKQTRETARKLKASSPASPSQSRDRVHIAEGEEVRVQDPVHEVRSKVADMK